MSDEPELTKDAIPGQKTMRSDADRAKARERYARKHPTAKPRKPRTRTRTSGTNQSLESPIREMLVTIGTVWGSTEAMRGGHVEPTCGEVLMDQAPRIAKALNIVAQDDPSVYMWLDRMMTGGGWGAVAFTVLPVFQAFAMAHVIPAIERRRAVAIVGPWSEEEPSPTPVRVERDDTDEDDGENIETPHGPDFGGDVGDLGPGGIPER